MKSRTKLATAALMSLSLALSACSGGGNSTENNTSKGNAAEGTSNQGAEKKDVYSFSFYVHYDWAGPIDPWGQDEQTKWIMSNKHIKPVGVSSGGAAEAKLNTMIASNSLPDVIQMDRGMGVEKLRAAGALVPLDDYLAKYPNIMEQVGKETIDMLRSSDGKLYQIPNWATKTPNGNSGWMINKKIYEELGSPKLETFDDLHAYLSLVKEKKPDIVPLEIDNEGTGFGIIYSGFKEDTPPVLVGHSAYAEGNELKPILSDPAYREAMAYTRKLFSEKLISQDALTQKQDQRDVKLKTGRVAVFVGGDTANVGEGADHELKIKDKNSGYTAIWPIYKAGLDKNKIMNNGWNSLGWNVNVITKAAKDPERIFEYFDWLISPEGQRVVWWGPPGILWNEIDSEGHPVFTEKWSTMSDEEKGKLKLQSFNFAGNASYIDSAKIKNEFKLPEEKRKWSTVAQAEVFWKSSKNVTEFVNIDPNPEQPEGIAAQSVKDIYKQTFAKALFAKDEAEMNKMLDEGLGKMDQVGFGNVLKFKTEAWHKNLEMLK